MWRVAFAAILGVGATWGLIELFLNRPMIEVDERGVFSRHLGMDRIPWDRIMSSELLPTFGEMKGSFLRKALYCDLWDGNRTIAISVRDPESLMRGFGQRIAHRVTNFLRRDKMNPGCSLMTIFTIGTTAKSNELQACIEEYLKKD